MDYEEHTVYYCPDCQTGGRILKDRRAVAAAAVKVGDTARRTRRISARDIELFTEMTGDRNPLHYDEEAAARSRFGGLIVQGGVTSGLLNAVVAEDLPGPGSVFLHVDWSFRAPVSPGDEITAEVEVVAVREDKPTDDAADDDREPGRRRRPRRHRARVDRADRADLTEPGARRALVCSRPRSCSR